VVEDQEILEVEVEVPVVLEKEDVVLLLLTQILL